LEIIEKSVDVFAVFSIIKEFQKSKLLAQRPRFFFDAFEFARRVSVPGLNRDHLHT